MEAVEHKDLGTITSPEVRACPLPFLKRLQAEQPVYYDAVAGGYVVTRYADCTYVYDNWEIFSNQADVLTGRATSPVAEEARCRFAQRGFPEVHTVATSDPPIHSRYRGLVDKVFTPSYVKEIEPEIRAIANGLIDNFIGKGQANFFEEFAVLFPMYVICDQLGIPREDWRRIKRWSDVMVERIDPVLSPERELQLVDEIIEMQNYCFGFLKKYRAEPQKNLLTKYATIEVDGAPLRDEEAVSLAYLTMVGGNETSTNAILSAFNILLTHDGMIDALRNNPQRITAFVEETMRSHSPVPVMYRRAKRDAKIGDVEIPKGSLVMISNIGANHDPERWQDPEAFEMDRKGGRNHLTFGRGLHFCPGALLAKAELRIAIEQIMERIPSMRLSPSYPAPKYMSHAFVHGLDSMHVVFDPA